MGVKGWIVDKAFLSDFKEAGMVGFSEGQKLILTIEDVEHGIKMIENFALSVKEIFLKIC
ncbi:MAG: hypothetical protein QW134_04785 [Nitrososphaeria archaeon]